MAAPREAITPRMERLSQVGTFDLDAMCVAHEAHFKPNIPVPSKGSLQSTAEPPLSTPAMFWTLRPGCQSGSCSSESQQVKDRTDVGPWPNIPETASLTKPNGDVKLFDTHQGQQGEALQLVPAFSASTPPPPPPPPDGDISGRRARTRRPASMPDMVDLDSLLASLQGQQSAETLPLPTRLAAFLLADATLLQKASSHQQQQQRRKQRHHEQDKGQSIQNHQLKPDQPQARDTPKFADGDSPSTLVPGIVPSQTPSFNPRPRLPAHGWKARETATSLSDDELLDAATSAARAAGVVAAVARSNGDAQQEGSSKTPKGTRPRSRSSVNILRMGKQAAEAVEESLAVATSHPRTPKQEAIALSNRAAARRCRSSDSITPVQRVSCQICMGPLSAENRESFCGVHACCFDCASGWASEQLGAGKLPRCWEPNCRQAGDPVVILRFLNPQEQEKYLNLALWSNPRVWACPQCHTLLFAEDGVPQIGWSSCPSCSHVFCLDCRCPRHEGEDCQKALKREEERLSKRKAPKKTSSQSQSSHLRSQLASQRSHHQAAHRERDQALAVASSAASQDKSHRHKKSSKHSEKSKTENGAQPASAWRAGKVEVSEADQYVTSLTLMVAVTPTGDEKPLFEHTISPIPRAGHKKSFSFGTLEKEMHQCGFKCCPRCRVGVEKSDDGCEHIVCSQCGHEFCWLCLADRKVIAAHGNHFHRSGCPLYREYWGPNDHLPERCDRCLIQRRACQVVRSSRSQEPAVVGQYYSSLLDACSRFFQHGLFFSTCSVTNVA
mmetsp:Transcript_62370/g.136319  ORF Transcript_62370/g.136319 Transcript_62370/m.136319 type:complete len:782 (+) Transcript_62370:274-2619(+)